MEPLLIRAEAAKKDSDTLVLRVNRPVSPGTPLYFSSAEEAEGHPLAQMLLRLGLLEAVLLQDGSITLLKPLSGPSWPEAVSAVSAAIEKYYAEEDKAAADQHREMTEAEQRLAYEVQEHLNAEINPLVASHGGFIEVLGIRSETVYVHMSGGCQGCGMASATLKQGVETSITKAFPQVNKVLDTTDHAAGKNPYYAPH